MVANFTEILKSDAFGVAVHIGDDVCDFGHARMIPLLILPYKRWRWGKTEFVKSTNIQAKGWLLDVLLCVERIRKQGFTLVDVYVFESYLQAKHLLNRNVRAKIRQQLQILRDKGVVRFVGRGRYWKMESVN